MDSTFAPDWSRARVLCYSTQEPSDGRVCLLWPAWAYRVTAPVLTRRGLDLFERVVLALCQAGIRRPDRIAELIMLDVRLCAHILDRAVRTGQLDNRYDLTDQGCEALRTNSALETPRWQVCFVFEDPFTGDVWPRTVDTLQEAYVIRSQAAEVELELRTLGRSDRVQARRVVPPEMQPRRPSAERVIAAASAQREALRIFQVREYERQRGLSPASVPEGLVGARGPGASPERTAELNRVAFLDGPEPVFLVGFLAVAGGRGTESAEAWTAYDPFGLGPSDLFQSLVYRFGRDDGTLDEEIRTRADVRLAAAGARRRVADDEFRLLLEQRLAHEFGPSIRDDPDAFDLMLGLDAAAESSQRDEALEQIAQTALRLYEVLFGRMLVAYPVATDTYEAFVGARALRRPMLEQAAQRTGFHGVTRLYTDINDDELRRTYNDPSTGFVKAMCALSLLAAPAHPDHPLRSIAAELPDLPVTLATLNQLRNRGAHARRDPANPHDATWCRLAAASAVRALLRLPESRTERILT